MDGGAWWAIVHGVAKSRTRLCDYTYLIYCLGFPGGSEDKASACDAKDPGLIPGLGIFPGKGMAIHSNIPAWKIPWTEEPGGL